MDFLGLHSFKQIVDAPGLRNIGGFTDQIRYLAHRNISFILKGHLLHSILQMQDADNIIHIFPVYRIPGITSVQHIGKGLSKRGIYLYGADIFPVSHDILRFLVGKLHDILNHFRFILFNHTLFMGIIHH